ncbi:MAG TPA: choice-of-anchor D domain-containing protein [Verrucomicrobiae bacterium]|nr:choice-of-anchor D domain-containing protein [Verrucomicrobiae bacterium]
MTISPKSLTFSGILGIAACFSGIPQFANAGTWYVDSAAKGANNGTSWSNAWTSINSASGVSPGDTVFISGGTTSTTYSFDGWSLARGTSSNWVTYRTGQDLGHNGIVILDASGPTQWFNASSPWYVTLSGQVGSATNLVIANYTGWKIYSGTSGYLHLSYIQFPKTQGQLNFYNSSHIEVDHCYFDKVYGNNDQSGVMGGPQDNGTGGFGWNSFHDNFVRIPCNASTPGYGDDGISWCASLDVYNNHFQIYFDGAYPTTGTAQHADVIQSDGQFIRVFNNVFEGVGESIFFFDALSAGNFHDVQFFNNVVYMINPTLGTVARCLDWRPEQQGGTLTRFLVANNTFVDENGLACLMLNPNDNFVNCFVGNNIFYNCNPLSAPEKSGLTFLYNKAIAGTHGSSSLSHTQIASAPGGSVIVFSRYSENSALNDLHLAPSDTGAIDRGTNFFSTYFSTDADGVSRPQGTFWDLGAYEFSSASGSPILSVTPSTQDYGSITVGTSSDRNFTVQNTGSGTLSGSVTASSPFAVISGGGYSLGSNQSQAVTVRFSPTTPGTNTQSLSFTGGNGATVQVRGVGLASTNPVISVNPISVDFGIVAAGSTADQSVTVKNVGSGILSGAVSAGAPFSIVSGASYTLGATQSQTVTIRYSPTVGGTNSQNLSFSGGGGAILPLTGVSQSLPQQGDTIAAVSGVITSPFYVSGTFITQDSQTTDPTTGGSAIYDLNITNAGKYVINTVVNAPDDASNSMFINVDAQPTDPTMIWDIPVTAGFEQRTVSWRGNGTDTANQFVPQVFTLSQGHHQIIVRGREAGVELQSLSVVNAAPPPPTGLRVVAQ